MNIEHGQIDIEQVKVEMELHRRAFETLAGLLVEHNRKMNLTRITEPQQIRVRHFLDSLVALQSLDKLAAGRADFCLADIGSGAGFPSLPLAIARPSWKIVSIEAAGKTLKSTPISLEVVKSAAPAKRQPAQTEDAAAQLGDKLFLKATVDRTRVLQGEQVNLLFKLYTMVDVVNFGGGKDPTFTGFWGEEVEIPKGSRKKASNGSTERGD